MIDLQKYGFRKGVNKSVLSTYQEIAFDRDIADKIGKRNGRLKVIAYDPTRILKEYTINPNCNKAKTILCKCDCGNYVYIRTTDFTTSKTRSCGCWHDENASDLNRFCYKHGDTHTRLYNILWGMIRRCYNKNDQAYPDYGGRGIKICDEWYTPEDHTIGWLRFKEWALANGYNDNLSIDRQNNDKGYSPDNCRWVTYKVQVENTRKNLWFYPFGKRISSCEYGHKIGHLSRTDRIAFRVRHGWSDYDAATIPTQEVRLALGCLCKKENYNGPRYDEDGILRDNDGFIVLIPKIKSKRSKRK